MRDRLPVDALSLERAMIHPRGDAGAFQRRVHVPCPALAPGIEQGTASPAAHLLAKAFGSHLIPSCAACPDLATPLYTLLRAAPAGLPRRAGGAPVRARGAAAGGGVWLEWRRRLVFFLSIPSRMTSGDATLFLLQTCGLLATMGHCNAATREPHAAMKNLLKAQGFVRTPPFIAALLARWGPRAPPELVLDAG